MWCDLGFNSKITPPLLNRVLALDSYLCMTVENHFNREDEAWIAAKGEEDEKPLVFRCRRRVPRGVVESNYPTLISIYWPYEPANESGMPDPTTNGAQVEFEEALDGLDSLESSLLMLVVTGNGRKEWHWYVRDIDDWMNQLNESLSGKPVFPIRIGDRHEPDWALYHDFISNVDEI